MPATSLTFTYRAYRAGTRLFAPLALRAARKRFEARDGPMERFAERNGHASLPRPKGQLIWMHTVSVGEFLSVLDLIRDLTTQGARLLVTTTTSTAAELAAQRLPEGVLHQFSPVDTPQAVDRFLNHWSPDLAVFVESEVWPNQIVRAHARGIPLALINARLSARSVEKWKRSPSTASMLFSRFDAILCQTEATATALVDIGARFESVTTSGDMKASAGPLPVNLDEAEKLAELMEKRPVWVASSTHEGEEEHVLAAHRIVAGSAPDALLILVPRHPERGDKVEALARQDGWTVARRSKGAPLSLETQVYLADTLGETGLWYQLAPIVFVGGSFVPVGGHNPYEPAHFDCAILHGPLYANFDLAYSAMTAADACLETEDATALGLTVAGLTEANRQQELAQNAKSFIRTAGNNRAQVAKQLLALMA